MLRLGLVGTGAMGSMIARSIDRGECPAARLVGVTDLDVDRARGMAASLASNPPVLPTAEVVEGCDLVVEAAGANALGELLPRVIASGKDILVLSVGGLIDRETQIAAAGARHSRIYCPSGAIAGLDAVRAAAVGRIEGATVTTRKPPAGLAGAPFFEDAAIDPMSLASATVIFEGSAREACRQFPANINVSAALSLAGIGVDRTRVTIIADPGIDRNLHRVEVWGDFGRMTAVTENVASENPRTSRLAALSAIALIRRLSAPFQIGT